jgi:hypothetical protein
VKKASTTMRLHHVLSLGLFSLVLHTGCSGTCDPNVQFPNPGACVTGFAGQGTPGGECSLDELGGGICQTGSVCIDDVCIPCGGNGQACCQEPAGPMFCTTPGSGCDQGPNSDEIYPRCTSSCTAGKACCADNYCTDSVCDTSTNTCMGAQSNPCVGGISYSVLLIDPNGCVMHASFSSDNDTDAQTCAQAILAENAGHGYTQLSALNAQQVCGDYCEISESGNAPVGGTECALTPQALAQCEQAQCTNCTIQPSACTD